MKLDAVYVVVKNMDAAIEFYSGLFGRNPVLQAERFSGFDLEGGLFGLFKASHMAEPIDSGSVVFGNNCVAAIRVKDLEEEHARISALAPPLITPIEAVETYHLFQVQDPDGNRVEFYEDR